MILPFSLTILFFDEAEIPLTELLNPMKKAILIVMLFACRQMATAQIPTWQWARGGTSTTQAICESYSVATDAFDDICYTGWYTTAISFGPYNLSSYHSAAFLAKYNTAGNILWAKTSIAPGTGGAEGTNVFIDMNNNIYITGSYQKVVSFDGNTLDSASLNNTFLVKYNVSGNLIWAVNTPDHSNSMAYQACTVDAAGNIYQMGYFTNQSLIIGPDTFVNALVNNADIFFITYDASGNILWAKHGAGDNVDYPNEITMDLQGNVYMTGYSHSNNLIFGQDTVHTNAGSMYVIKFDSSGNMIWNKAFGPSANDWTAITFDSHNDFYLGGTITGSSLTIDAITLTPPLTAASFLAKFDANGNVIWAKCGGGRNGACGVVVDNMDNPYILGGFGQNNISFDTVYLTAHYQAPYFDPLYVVKYDSSGHVQWGTKLASGADDVCGIAIGPTNNIYIGADYTYDTLIAGNDTLLNPVFGEYPYVAKLGYPSIGENINLVSANTEACSLFPNPFHNNLNINLKDDAPAELIIYDITGRKILQSVFTRAATINTDHLAAGIYIYKVSNAGGVATEGKIIKQ